MKGKIHRASGGSVNEGVAPSDKGPTDVYAGGNSEVVKSARNRTGKFKKGGKVEDRMAKKSGGCAEGGMSAARADRAPRKGRASGGVLSSAANTSDRPGAKVTHVA
jgi:hypothetical protein